MEKGSACAAKLVAQIVFRAAISLMVMGAVSFARGQNVVINEFLAVNDGGLADVVAFKPALDAANWIPLNEFPPRAAPGSHEYDDLIPAGTAQRYYRISSEE